MTVEGASLASLTNTWNVLPEEQELTPVLELKIFPFTESIFQIYSFAAIAEYQSYAGPLPL